MAQLLYNSAFEIEKHPINIDKFFEYFIQSQKPENAVLVLPTNKYVSWAKEQFIQKYFNQKKLPTPELKFYNLQNFAQFCLNSLTKKSKYTLLSDAAILAIMEEAANTFDLQYFKPKNGNISLTILQKLKNIILGLKEDGISPENMQQELETMQKIVSAELRFSDLTKIYKKYENLLGNNLLDAPAVFNKVVFELENIPNSENNSTSENPTSEFTSKNNHQKNNNQKKSEFPLDTIISGNSTTNKNSIISENSIIMFNGFSEFKLPEAKFVAQFAKSKIPTIVNIDYSQIEGPNIESLPQNVRRLVVADLNQKSIGLRNSSDDKNNFNKNTFNKNAPNKNVLKPSEHIKKWLFNEEQSLFNEKILEQIKIFEMPDRIEEVKHLAHLVRYLNQEKQIPFSEMCICSRQPKLYADLFREFFSESGLVVNISDRFSLVNAAPIVLIFALLEIVANNWQRSDIERIIFSQIILKNIPNIAVLITVAKKYRIIGGNRNYNSKNANYSIEKWKNTLTKHKNFAVNIKTKSLTSSDFDEDLGNIEKNIEELEQAISVIEQLEKILDFKNQNYSFSEFSQLIKNQIIAKLKIAEDIFYQYENLYFNTENNVANHHFGNFRASEFQSSKQIEKNGNLIANSNENQFSLNQFQILEEIEKNGKSLSKFIEILDELEKIEIERKGDVKYKLNELIEKLKTALSAERYQLNEKNSLGINITSIEQTRGIPYAVMILCGAVDTEFPISFKTDTFLGKELRNSEQLHDDNERILFYQFLTNNVDLLDNSKMRIFITYPTSAGNKKFVRSPFIDDLCQITSNDTVSENILKLSEIKEEQHKYPQNFLVENELEWLNYLTQTTDIYNFFISNPEQLTSKYNTFTSEYKNNYERILANYYENKSFRAEAKFGIKQDKLTTDAQKFQEKLNDRIYSISQLENYAKCPFSFFVENILQLKLTEYLDDELSALDFGNYLHKILEQFYKQNLEKSDNFIANHKTFDVKISNKNQENEEQKNEYLEQLQRIVDNLIGELDFPFFRYEKLKIVGKNGILENWLTNEIAKIDDGWRFASILFEYKFGYKSENLNSKNFSSENFRNRNDYVTLHSKDGGAIKIRGKIDRIEICENDDEIYFIISDYKSTKNSIKSKKIKDIEEGKSLQIPIYLLVIKELFSDMKFIPFGGLYYILSDGKLPKVNFYDWAIMQENQQIVNQEREKKLTKCREEFEDILENSCNYASRYKNDIMLLKFNSSKNKDCKYCNFNKLCRVDGGIDKHNNKFLL